MSDLDAFIHKAQLLLQHKKPSEAEKQLAQVIRQDPENTQALSLLARCKFDQKKFTEGIDIIKQAIAIAPLEDYYFYLLAFGNYQMNRHAPALDSLQQAISLNPYVADYFGLFSLILIEEKNFKKALSLANEGLAIDGENITCLNARSTALNKLKLTDDAMETMRSALDQDPENDFTHTTIGWNLLEKGRNKEAALHFKEALRINPELEGARVGLKESLKSKIPPYKWLLQYSFWINNQGKQARWAIPLGIYLAVRVITSVSGSGANGAGLLGGLILGLYLLMVATSWIINPLANFFLLFNPDGKHALTSNEKLNSLLLIGAIALGLMTALTGLILSGYRYNPDQWYIAALIILSLGFPLGHMQFPLRFKGASKLQGYSMALVSLGIVSVILLAVAPLDSMAWAITIYGVSFVVFTWLNAFFHR